jgi:hypothetical protein
MYCGEYKDTSILADSFPVSDLVASSIKVKPFQGPCHIANSTRIMFLFAGQASANDEEVQMVALRGQDGNWSEGTSISSC